jgi:glycine cleavage system H lipoate-binding protein
MLKLLTCFSGLQEHLGDVVFVELPEVGSSVSQGNNFGAVESVKATSDVISPVSGEVVEVNGKLSEEPGLVSHDSTVSKTNLKISIAWVD